MKQFFIINEQNRERIAQVIRSTPEGMCVRISEPTRSLEQNAALWAMLTDVANQITWHGRKLDAESWKHMFTASLRKQDVVPNLEGNGFVVLGSSTSRMNKKEFADLLELIQAFGAERNVKWSA